MTATAWVDVSEYRPGRNFVRVGDVVRCRPFAGRSFDARVRRIRVSPAGQVEVEVYGGPPGRSAVRTFNADRITRRAQSKAEHRVR